MVSHAASHATVNQPLTVVIAAGGTGGHVVPALAVAAALQAQRISVIWLGTREGLEARMVPAKGIEMRWISIAGLRGKSLGLRLLGPFRLLCALMQSIVQLRSIRPIAVLGMGGFVSGPVGIAALLLRKPLVLHEQNAIAGLTNRWLGPWADAVFCAWPNTFKSSVHPHIVGNPVLPEMAKAAGNETSSSPVESNPMKILVVGGSRGARALNECVPQAINLLGSPVCVHHQTGQADESIVRKRYAQIVKIANSSFEVTSFIDDMHHAYHQADLVICRSGAMTVTELSALGVPSILVPFPHAVDDHQTYNARHLSERGAAVLMPQDTLSPQRLADELQSLLEDRSRLTAMRVAARQCFIPAAAESVAQGLLGVAR